MAASDLSEEIGQLRRMRLASLFEGATLVVLVFIAVPLKHLGGYKVATSVVGPVHGFAFILYLWMLIRTVAGGGFTSREVLRMALAAFIPFGAFVNERALRRREIALSPAA